MASNVRLPTARRLRTFRPVPAPHDPRALSRRDMLARLFQPVKRAAAAASPTAPAAPVPPAPRPRSTERAPIVPYSTIAVIAGRECLAYQGTSCTTCVDRCPVPGALVLTQGLPRVEPSICTGCRICHEVCPAPGLAIRIVPRPPGLPPPNATTAAPAHSPFPVLKPPAPPPPHG